jgi:hypothetical protein
MADDELIQLNAESSSAQAILLSRPDISNGLGADGGYRLASLVMGYSGVRIYEAISGTQRSVPGQNMHVTLSFAEMDRLIEAYRWHRIALDEQKRRYLEAVEAGDGPDPFANSDPLP